MNSIEWNWLNIIVVAATVAVVAVATAKKRNWFKLVGGDGNVV